MHTTMAMPTLSDPPSNAGKPDISSLTNGTSAMAYALDGLANDTRTGSDGTWTPDTDSIGSDEDSARALKPKGRDVDAAGSRSSTAIPSDGSSIQAHSDGIQASKANKGGKPRKSIQVIVEKADRKGRYILTADDPDFRDIMRSGMEREAAKLSGKTRSRIRNLVFTRQFTTFDRQNPLASQSPFHGFFTLFWLAMFLLLVKIAAQNYKNQGSIFGRAEILHLMVDRDLFALLVTDGALCFATSFGFFLQKAIAKGYLTWNGSGWIIQSLWQVFFTGSVIWVSFYRDWPWTHTVFIVLHDFVLLMKQHSYAFYNGYREYLLLQTPLPTN
jgi:sterol O-acyltransferase